MDQNRTRNKQKKNNEVKLLHVNGHTTVRPGKACVPLDDHW